MQADLHDGWEIMFYQELTHPPDPPFSWDTSKANPKMFHSVLPGGAEGSCILASERVAPYAFAVDSPCQGALCTVLLLLSGMEQFLLMSVYAQPRRCHELEKVLNELFDKYPPFIIRGDFNAQISGLDTTGTTIHRWRWLNMLIDKKTAVDTFRAKNSAVLQYTRYQSALLPCDRRIDLFLASTALLSTPHLKLLDAVNDSHDCTSDHHPISITLKTPCTPAYRSPHALQEARTR